MGKRTAVNWRSWTLRLTGSAAFLGLLFWLVPVGDLWAGLRNIPPLRILWVLLGFVLGHMIAAGKWWLLMDRPFGFSHAMRAHFAGLAANLCLPTVAGGDAVRAALAYRKRPDAGRIAAAATTDRLIDLGALAALAVLGALAAGSATGTAMTALFVITSLGAAMLWFLPRLITWLWARYPKLPAASLAQKLSLSLSNLARRPGLLLLIWLTSMMVQIAFIALAYSLALAVGVEVSFAAWGFAWALAKIIAILPLSINGLGLREASLAALLAPFEAVSALVVAAGLAWQFVLFLTGGLGALVLFVTPEAPASVPESSEMT
ncbi:MAG: lysylphosphatidylglycerol synthase transmembrane domain-containing protein [Mangrovicoccus sp.]